MVHAPISASRCGGLGVVWQRRRRGRNTLRLVHLVLDCLGCCVLALSSTSESMYFDSSCAIGNRWSPKRKVWGFQALLTQFEAEFAHRRYPSYMRRSVTAANLLKCSHRGSCYVGHTPTPPELHKSHALGWRFGQKEHQVGCTIRPHYYNILTYKTDAYTKVLPGWAPTRLPASPAAPSLAPGLVAGTREPSGICELRPGFRKRTGEREECWRAHSSRVRE